MKLIIGLILAIFAATSVHAASGTTTASQQRMKDCAPLTKGMQKDERSAFMKQCLSKAGHDAAMASKGHAVAAGADAGAGAGAADGHAAQQEKMKACNADATRQKLKGADRKAFMKTCLSASGSH